MAGPAHPRAMMPEKTPSTRVAPPQTPGSWPSHPRMRVYTLFGLTGLVYLLVGFVTLRLVWALGSGPVAWDDALLSFAHPLYIAFHVVALGAVLFVGVRFFRLFPKAQPASIGPLKPPPAGVIHGMLYLIWIGATLLIAAVLAGVIF